MGYLIILVLLVALVPLAAFLVAGGNRRRHGPGARQIQPKPAEEGGKSRQPEARPDSTATQSVRPNEAP